MKGCDGSILLKHEGSERTSEVSKTLKGFEVVDDIKAELEKQCPKTVSCADILTTVARDATVVLGGPYWAVPYGRKDGKISIDKEAEIVPKGHENVTSLIEYFQSKGLTILDLVVLSGKYSMIHLLFNESKIRVVKLDRPVRPNGTKYKSGVDLAARLYIVLCFFSLAQPKTTGLWAGSAQLNF